jgi:hypothetical protein
MADDSGTLVSSGSSLNMPTGSGSERLRRATIHALNNGWQEILSGTAGHIYTVLSIIFCSQSGNAGNIQIKMNNGGQDIFLISGGSGINPIAGEATFVWSDKFVMEEDDDLDVYNASSNGDFIVTYIDQDWS